MKPVELSIAGAFLLESPVWRDDRGYFREWFKLEDLRACGADFVAQQANLSMSARNVVRGLHYSLAPEGQAKAVTCVVGELDDVIVDIRVGSPTYGAVEVIHLSADAGRTVYLPPGTAHGFCVVSEVAGLAYLLSSPFNPSRELEINPFDEEIAVAWTITGDPLLSEKDRVAPTLAQRLVADELPRY